MALLFIDGFDHYDDIRQKWIVSNSFDNPTFVTGRFAGLALKKQSQNNASSIHQIFDQQAEVFVGVAIFSPGLDSNRQVGFKDVGGTERATMKFNSDGSVTVTAGGQSATSDPATITQSQWHYLEVRYKCDSSVGQLECRVDEVVVASISGDTTTGADADIGSVYISGGGSNGPRYLYDDLYILNILGADNTGYLGDVRVSTLHTLTSGNTNDFAPVGVPTTPEAVGETILNGDTDYAESGQLGAAEDYTNQTFDNLGVSPGIVYGVQTTNAAKKTDAGTIKYKDEMVIAGVRFDDGTEVTPGSGGYFCSRFIRDTDPSDGEAWTEEKVAVVGSGYTITFREV